MLTTYTSPPPPHMGPGSVRPAFQQRGRATGQRSQFTCLVYISTYHPNKASILSVYSQPLTITVPVVIGTCTVLVGTVESVPVPPQFDRFPLKRNNQNFQIES